MRQTIELREVSRGDIERMLQWLEDPELAEQWFGWDTSGEPIHLGYRPWEVLQAGQHEWVRVFGDPRRHIASVYTVLRRDEPAVHIGEAHLVTETALGNAELAVFIGRKDLWNRGYGTAVMEALLRRAFDEFASYRAWVDVPVDNKSAIRMCEKLGFATEGLLRQSRPRGHSRVDSIVMSLLAREYIDRMERELALIA